MNRESNPRNRLSYSQALLQQFTVKLVCLLGFEPRILFGLLGLQAASLYRSAYTFPPQTQRGRRETRTLKAQRAHFFSKETAFHSLFFHGGFCGAHVHTSIFFRRLPQLGSPQYFHQKVCPIACNIGAVFSLSPLRKNHSLFLFPYTTDNTSVAIFVERAERIELSYLGWKPSA